MTNVPTPLPRSTLSIPSIILFRGLAMSLIDPTGLVYVCMSVIMMILRQEHECIFVSFHNRGYSTLRQLQLQRGVDVPPLPHCYVAPCCPLGLSSGESLAHLNPRASGPCIGNEGLILQCAELAPPATTEGGGIVAYPIPHSVS